MRFLPFLLLSAILLPSVGRSDDDALGSGRSSPRFATVFTFLDAVFNTKKVWTREDVSDAIARAKELGVQRIYWRVDAGGMFVYPTVVGTAYQWDGRPQSANLVDSIKALGDPLAVFAEEALKQGIEFYAWYPIRDRNSTAHTYNPHNPKEREQFDRVGRHLIASRFYLEHLHYNMERRQGAGEAVATPVVESIRIRTDTPGTTLSAADLRLWESDDNLQYMPVEDSWKIRKEASNGEIESYVIEGLHIAKPWVKLVQRTPGKWNFSGGSLDEWITFIDPSGREWFPYPWMATGDRTPAVGEARFPYKAASRAKGVRNSVPWNTFTQFQYGSAAHSMAFYTPAMPPHRYLLGYPCFSYPEVRAYEMKVIEELLERPIDGIAISIRTHVQNNGSDEYGFNPPIAEEYQRRHGVDPRTSDYEYEKLRVVIGDAYTEMLREISQAVRAKGKQLVAMYEPDRSYGLEWQPGQMMPWWSHAETEWQWERWSREGIVDQLLIMTTGFNLPWDDLLQSYLKEVRSRTKTPISLHYDPDYNPRRQSSSAYQKLLRGALGSNLVDEVNVFEFVEFWSPEQPLYKATRALKLHERSAAEPLHHANQP